MISNAPMRMRTPANPFCMLTYCPETTINITSIDVIPSAVRCAVSAPETLCFGVVNILCDAVFPAVNYVAFLREVCRSAHPLIWSHVFLYLEQGDTLRRFGRCG